MVLLFGGSFVDYEYYVMTICGYFVACTISGFADQIWAVFFPDFVILSLLSIYLVALAVFLKLNSR